MVLLQKLKVIPLTIVVSMSCKLMHCQPARLELHRSDLQDLGSQASETSKDPPVRFAPRGTAKAPARRAQAPQPPAPKLPMSRRGSAPTLQTGSTWKILGQILVAFHHVNHTGPLGYQGWHCEVPFVSLVYFFLNWIGVATPTSLRTAPDNLEATIG